MYYIALVDDHNLMRQGLASLINKLPGFNVLFEAENGKDFITRLKPRALPDLVLMDITMPEMDGYETTNWLRLAYPKVPVLALSIMDEEHAIIRMLKSGAKGYLLKNTKPQDLKVAMEEVIHKGFYFNELVSNRIVDLINSDGREPYRAPKPVHLTEREIQFIQLACTERTYKEIADIMFISARTADGYRDNLFEKLGLKGRVGLVIYAIKNRLIEI